MKYYFHYYLKNQILNLLKMEVENLNQLYLMKYHYYLHKYEQKI